MRMLTQLETLVKMHVIKLIST